MPASPPSPHALALPPPTPHPTTPGPRALAFTTLFTSALTHTLHRLSYPAFAACFPTPAHHTPDLLHTLWQQVTQQIASRSQREFAAVCDERGVVARLNELEALVSGGARRGRALGEAAAGRDSAAEAPVPPHRQAPRTVFLAHLAGQLARTQARLVARLEAVRRANEELVARIGAQRGEMEGLVGGWRRW
ncbi:MAG: hypothetical protein FRX48_00891 [Lasallia pustulata]|uniref:MIND kinetochore complex component Nnf1 n=1 Tax=Lasallia pustulata TaxID=136370 RepID=A0A5M8Q599_9LECA|nr:MAG: hypothetical protein FRX48_00891 [Lasallia pustulata]